MERGAGGRKDQLGSPTPAGGEPANAQKSAQAQPRRSLLAYMQQTRYLCCDLCTMKFWLSRAPPGALSKVTAPPRCLGGAAVNPGCVVHARRRAVRNPGLMTA